MFFDEEAFQQFPDRRIHLPGKRHSMLFLKPPSVGMIKAVLGGFLLEAAQLSKPLDKWQLPWTDGCLARNQGWLG